MEHSDLLFKKIQWLLKPSGSAFLIYNKQKPEDTEYYRNSDMEIPQSYGNTVSDEFWSGAERDDPCWVFFVGNKPQ